MNIGTIQNIGTNVYRNVRGAADTAIKTVNAALANSQSAKNLKNALPGAAICTGAFSLMSLLPNNKSDGSQKKLEKKSGNIAAAVFAFTSFKTMFNTGEIKIKDALKKLKKLDYKDAQNILKTNKSNLILYALSIAGVKIATDVATKGLDFFVNEATGAKVLGED